MSYLVTQRSREIGIRMALGASRNSMLGLVLAEAGILVGIGVAIALPAAYSLTRFAKSLLFGVGAQDPWVFLTATVLLGSVALFAGYLPASRAARVDPMRVLRED